jgi:hypothetical protein
MLAPWHLDETYGLVKAAFGRAQEALVRESTRSVLDRQAFARYHYHETLRLSKSFERTYLKKNLLIDLHGDPSGRVRNAFDRYIVKAGAHATAAAQSIHAIPDILAHAVYFATGQNLGPNVLPERKVGLPSVTGGLRRQPEFQGVGDLLSSAQSGRLWKHLVALANVSKHRSVVRTSLNEDWTGTRKNHRELHFSHFEREGERFPSVSVVALLGPEFDRLSLLIIQLGHQLNASLRARAG